MKKNNLLTTISLLLALCPVAFAADPVAPQNENAPWPPALRGADANGTATITTDEFLKIPQDLEKLRTDGKAPPFTMAKTAPTVDVVYHNNLPGRSANGTGWSAWGDIAVASDGKVYVGTGNHGSNTKMPTDGGGYTFLYCWDPSTKTLKQVADINKLLGVREEDPKWTKMHAGIVEGQDKKIYYTLTLNDGGESYKTKWTSHVPGGQLFQYDPQTGESKIVATFPGEVTPTTLMDTKRNLFYANLEGKTKHSDIALGVVDMATNKLVYETGHDDVISSRNFALARDGKLYFNGRAGFWKYDPDAKTITSLNLQIPVSPGSGKLIETSFLNLNALVSELQKPANDLGTYLREQLTPATLALVTAYDNTQLIDSVPSKALATALCTDLNKALQSPDFYAKERFPNSGLTPQLQELLKQKDKMEPISLNRMLLAAALPTLFATDQSQWMRSSTPETADGYIYGTTTSGGQLFRFSPSKNEVTILGKNFGEGEYTPVTILSPDEKFLYYVPGGHGPGMDVETPLVQYNIATGERKVLAFLRPAIAKATGYAPSGTFGAKISADGSTVYINFNGDLAEEANPPKHSPGFGLTGLGAVHIPASERK
ncbi:MAG: hypothetical protein ABI615_10110 [Chthoniobacterales bacterium]